MFNNASCKSVMNSKCRKRGVCFCVNRNYLARLLCTVCLTVGAIESSIVTEPKNEIVLAGDHVDLHCCTDLPYPMDWHWTPSNSKHPIELYYGQIHTNWTTSVRVNTSIPGCFHLTIDKVEKRHAGKYECFDNEGFKGVKVSAELNVVGGMPRCEYIVDANYTRITISSSFSMSGNLDPRLNCSIQDHPSTHIDFCSETKNGTNMTVLTEVISTNQSNLAGDANVTCAIFVDGGSRFPHILTSLKRNQNMQGLVSPTCCDIPKDSQYLIWIWISATIISVIVIVIVSTILVIIFIKRKYSMRKVITGSPNRTATPEQVPLAEFHDSLRH